MAANVYKVGRVLFIFVQIYFSLTVGQDLGSPLYTSEDPITQLNTTTFRSSVCGQENTWLVEFYSSWCGHCIDFAPVFKLLARDVQEWWRVVRIGSVDCAQEYNLEICRAYDVDSYPTMKFFPSHTRGNFTGESFIQPTHVVLQLQHGIVDYITKQAKKASSKIPSGWPDLLPLGSLNDIWEGLGTLVQHVTVIFEEEGSYLGRQIILDTSGYRNLVVRRMLRKNVTKYGINSFPSLYLIDKGGTFKKLTEHPFNTDTVNTTGIEYSANYTNSTEFQDRKSFLEALQKLAGPPPKAAGLVGAPAPPKKSTTSKAIIDIEHYGRVHMQDLESALRYSLWQEVGLHKSIQGDALSALQDYITVLNKYFPGQPHVRAFLKKVDDWLSSQNNEPIKGQDWLSQVDSLQTSNAYLPPTLQWVGCRGSRGGYRGYPCGLWTLFHTLTVNSVIGGKLKEHLEVLIAMRGYIKHFFGCRECAKNFGKPALSIEETVKSANQTITWLWAGHNRANHFLRGDKTEDPEHPKVQFPTASMCPACHKADGTGWNEQQVLKFLIGMYAEKKMIQDSMPYTFIPKQVGGLSIVRSYGKVRMQDLESALHYSLRQEVGLHRVIEGASLTALKDFVRVLYKYFPGKEHITAYLKKLDSWLAKQEKPMTGEDWLKHAQELQSPSAFLPTTLKWTGCKGSTNRYRGYPCSLWMLFHTLTVNSVVGGGLEDPLEVLKAMRGYIKEYFGCRECSKNFGKMAVTIEDEVKVPTDSLMWLWSAHNKANKRLHGDASEDPIHPKTQFPIAAICKSCHTISETTDKWHRNETLKFLIGMYSKENIIQDSEPFTFSVPIDENLRTKNDPHVDQDTNMEDEKDVKLTDQKQWQEKKDQHDLQKISRLHTEKQDKLRKNSKKFSGRYNKSRIDRLRQRELDTRVSSIGYSSAGGFNRVDISLCAMFYLMCSIIILLLYFHLTIRRRTACKKYSV